MDTGGNFPVLKGVVRFVFAAQIMNRVKSLVVAHDQFCEMADPTPDLE